MRPSPPQVSVWVRLSAPELLDLVRPEIPQESRAFPFAGHQDTPSAVTNRTTARAPGKVNVLIKVEVGS